MGPLLSWASEHWTLTLWMPRLPWAALPPDRFADHPDARAPLSVLTGLSSHHQPLVGRGCLPPAHTLFHTGLTAQGAGPTVAPAWVTSIPWHHPEALVPFFCPTATDRCSSGCSGARPTIPHLPGNRALGRSWSPGSEALPQEPGCRAGRGERFAHSRAAPGEQRGCGETSATHGD